MKKKLLGFLILIIISGFLIPQRFEMPVEGASSTSFHPKSFWYYPWGKSVTHKGVDIFAAKGTRLNSSTEGFVMYTGQISMGGNIVVVLGPKWRLHYYAHLDKIETYSFKRVNKGEKIGTVGTSGNAQGKPPHLHYSIATIFPYFWRMDTSVQGWKKMWYLNPIEFLK